MAEESDLEKTEPASERRLEKARESGDIPRSKDFAGAIILLSAGAVVWSMGGVMMHRLRDVLKSSLSFHRDVVYSPDELFRVIKGLVFDTFATFLPFGILIMVVCVAATIAVGGWIFSPSAFMPKFSKLNPINGLGNMVSQNSLAELLKAIVKALIVGVAAWGVVSGKIPEFLRMSEISTDASVAGVGKIMWEVYVTIVAALLMIGVADAAYQKWRYAERMKMSRQEVRDEAKEAEGNPEIKAKLRQQQREMARRRMMAEIPKADVVITNPTHYAVALKYSESGNSAPRVIAKGVDDVAAKIREVASEHKVLMMEAPPLARALHANTELGDEIPEALYSAVAEVLAYVFQLRAFNKGAAMYPEKPSGIAVPAGLDPFEAAIPDENVE